MAGQWEETEETERLTVALPGPPVRGLGPKLGTLPQGPSSTLSHFCLPQGRTDIRVCTRVRHR